MALRTIFPGSGFRVPGSGEEALECMGGANGSKGAPGTRGPEPGTRLHAAIRLASSSWTLTSFEMPLTSCVTP
jgi:hypothetical protein